jgi:ATP phosphoribosyltransferase regulatory subunit
LCTFSLALYYDEVIKVARRMRGAIPEGVRDRLPREAALQRWLSGRLNETFRQWGYREVMTPTFEYVEGVLAGAGVLGRRADLYQFFDRRGATLALRPDMTTPIARLVATRLSGEPLPLRLAYIAPVFRYPRGRATGLHEVWQAGVELIGAASPLADAEVVALACQALTAAGSAGFQLGLGHVAFVEGLFSQARLAPELCRELKAALVARDLVGYERQVRQAGVKGDFEDLLLSLPTFRGGVAEAVAQFGGIGGPAVDRALSQLGRTLDLLTATGLDRAVTIDLGLCHALDYYTGLIFEGYLPGVGAPVLTGGRYDRLLSNYGVDEGATGFALDVDRVLEALERQGRLPEWPGPSLVLACLPGQEVAAMQTAARLRAEGYAVEIDLAGRSGEELLAYARARGAQVADLPVPAGETGRPDRAESGQALRPQAGRVESIH